VTDPLRELVSEVHAAPGMLVYEFAGAGVQALAWLHAIGGSSRTMLEATDRYAPRSLEEAIGVRPDKVVSPDVARRLAAHARRRAIALAPAGVSVAGVACTATIATDRPKRGQHGVSLAVATTLGTFERSVTLVKGARDRSEEEAVVSQLVLGMIAAATGVLRRVPPTLHRDEVLEEHFEPAPLLAQFAAGERPQVALDADGSLCRDLPWPEGGVALVCGAFNPLHEGHIGLAAAAQQHLGRPVAFELALANAEKATIDLPEAYRRAMQFPGRGPLLFTRAPLFSDKARLVPGAVFVLGADTAARVLSARFYDGEDALDASLDAVRAYGSRFLVAGRRDGERFLTLDDLQVPERHADLFEALPEDAFRADVSSSGIREGWSGGHSAEGSSAR
jgi:nicotinamide mononucleotide (NMN) deamidase PncC